MAGVRGPDGRVPVATQTLTGRKGGAYCTGPQPSHNTSTQACGPAVGAAPSPLPLRPLTAACSPHHLSPGKLAILGLTLRLQSPLPSLPATPPKTFSSSNLFLFCPPTLEDVCES